MLRCKYFCENLYYFDILSSRCSLHRMGRSVSKQQACSSYISMVAAAKMLSKDKQRLVAEHFQINIEISKVYEFDTNDFRFLFLVRIILVARVGSEMKCLIIRIRHNLFPHTDRNTKWERKTTNPTHKAKTRQSERQKCQPFCSR